MRAAPSIIKRCLDGFGLSAAAHGKTTGIAVNHQTVLRWFRGEVKVLELQLKESQQTEAELKRRKAIISRAIEDLELGES